MPADVEPAPDRLELRYVPLAQARRWDDNPKLHALDALVKSIRTHGFGDPAKYDSTLGGLVYGNGRTEALERMRDEGQDPPRGIAQLEDGEWAVPVIFGVDAESRAAAIAFAVDHNNLTLLGGGLGLEDMLGVWDEERLLDVLRETPDATALLASMDAQDIDSLIHGPDFAPVAAEEQSRLDEKAPKLCPHCGEEIER